MHDPRGGGHGHALAYAVSPRGACHVATAMHFMETGACNYPEIGFEFDLEALTDEGKPETIEIEFPWTEIEPFTLRTVKTVIEDLRVLEVISVTQAPTSDATPTPGPAGLPSSYILILEVTMQQAEVLRFAQDEGWPFQLLLRHYSDRTAVHDPNSTTGISAWILLDPEGNYRMPIGREIPYPITEGDLPSGIIP